jgi:hypothetical protein
MKMTTPEPVTSLNHARGIWSLVHAERAALAADLAELTDQQWATLSLCTEFTVRQVLAHGLTTVPAASNFPIGEPRQRWSS